MDIDLLKTLGQVLGIGGLALGVFFLLFREVIRKSIFPTLKKDDAYRLLRLISVLIWSVAVVGIGAWIWGDRTTAASSITTTGPQSPVVQDTKGDVRIDFNAPPERGNAQDVRTQAPCSPVVEGTKGNVTLTFNGGCTVGITPAELKEIMENVLARRAIPPELLDRYEMLNQRFGVTDTALTNFFRILGENKVPTENLDAKLREVAGRHVTLLKKTEPSVDDDPQVAAIKKQNVAAIGAGDYGHAEDLLQRAFDADLAAGNKRVLSAAKTKADMGELKLTQLRYAAAAQDFQEAANLVPSGELLVRSAYLNSLGSAARNAGNYPFAATAFAEALSIREKMLDPEHPDVATSLNNLALLYEEQGRYAEAEPLYKRALAIGEKVLGPEHPNIAIRLSNLAALYHAQGRYAEAEPLFKRALAINEKALGPEHPNVATGLNNLAALYRAQGRYAEAEPLYKRALAIDEKVLGPENPDVANGLNNLAALYYAQSLYADAEPLFERALAIGEKVLGPEHPIVAIRLNNLAELYRAQGRYAEAEPFYRRALAIDEKALGPEHPGVANALNNLALLYNNQGRHAEAEPLFKRALAIDEKALGPEHRGVATDLNNLAGLYRAQGRYAECRATIKVRTERQSG